MLPALVWSALIIAGCEAASLVDDDVRQDISTGQDARMETTGDVHIVLPPDIEDDFTTWDAFAELAEAVADSPWSPGPGEAGYPCSIPADCNEGYCIQTGNGTQCSVTCEEECPFDWSCLLYTPSLPDQVNVCMAPLVQLCKPCLANTDCWTMGVDGGEACVSYGGDGFFCGGSCDTQDDCPPGYQCTASTDVAGGMGDQCILSQGECECKQWYVDAGATTSCFVDNEYGTCPGDRQCLAPGLTECSAETPAPEICNGLDDDCDGDLDEETAGDECFVTNQFGSCPGLTDCTDGNLACLGVTPHAEQCDGEDNDCDGQIDEGFEDTDGDGVADCLESDIDGDGVPDVQDNCPADFNPGQEDNDLDNFGDPCDADDDNDKTADYADCAPKDDQVHPDAEEICDGKDNNCNYIVDEGFTDNDADGWKDCVDDDDDNDGTIDAVDCLPLDPLSFPAAPEQCDGKDNNCNQTVDEGFIDTDEDGDADCVDLDDDNDLIPDLLDGCPLTYDPDHLDMDGDGIGDACDKDADGDSIPDAVDNCLGVPNTSQNDQDSDGDGDVCDQDIDGDGALNDEDNCPLVANPGQEDMDNDATGDACEDDADGDGAPDQVDCAPLDPAVYPGKTETCDGLDNDCDLAQDEGFPDNDGDGIKDCVDDDDDGDGDPDETDCAALDPATNHQAVEVCDGVDNDCSGEIDEGLGKITCGKGACLNAVPACTNGLAGVCDPFAGIAEEICDGVDNDCNGLTDEALGFTSCGLGTCAHTVANCANGQVPECDPFEGEAVEVCDGLDNDCDGKTDEQLGTLSCGKGACFHTVAACIGGEEQTCNAFAGALPESCDGIDNDCDGDEDEDLGNVTCGKGNCSHEQAYCQDGKVAICDPFLGVAVEVCDGDDNDCDGLVDEDLWPVTCGKGVCAHSVPGCAGGQVPVCDPQEGAGDEICDGLDNDCNGLVDEGLGITSCGLGQCLHTVTNCLNGEPQECDAMAGSTDEVCDGADNDCDGQADPQGAVGCSYYYVDADTDGYGVDGQSLCLCSPDAPYLAALDGDCADDDGDINPGADENCATLDDENCDGNANEGCTYLSCAAALATLPGAPSGAYTLDPDGDGAVGAFAVWCDMETNGGGWTLVMKTSSASDYVYDHGVWTETSGGSEAAPDPTLDEDYVSSAFYTLAGTESRIALGDQNQWNSWTHAHNNARNLSNQGRMAGSYGGAGNCTARTNCGSEPINLKPLGLQEACSTSTATKWHRFGYVNDLNGWGTGTRVGFSADNDGSDSSDTVMGMGLKCWSSCASNSVTDGPHGKGSGFYLYHGWAATPYDNPVRGWLWIR